MEGVLSSEVIESVESVDVMLLLWVEVCVSSCEVVVKVAVEVVVSSVRIFCCIIGILNLQKLYAHAGIDTSTTLLCLP